MFAKMFLFENGNRKIKICVIFSEQEQTENKKNACDFISAGNKKCSLEIEKNFTVIL